MEPSETISERIRKVLRAMPEVKNETLYEMFPEVGKSTIRTVKSDYIRLQEIKALRDERDKPERNTMDELKIPERQGRGRPSKMPDAFDEDDLPSPTGRHWKGEIWRIDQMGKLQWVHPPVTDLSYAHWYETFYNNEYNFPCPTPLGTCHKEWGTLLDSGIKRLVMLCPRDHHKSSYINNGYTTFDICEHRGNWRGIMNVAWDKDLTLANTLTIVQNLNYNPLIIDFYGGLIDLDRPNTSDKKYFRFQPKGSRPGLFCTAFKTGAITGTHPHMAMFDDIQDELFSAQIMEKFHRVMDNKVLPAVGLDGRIIITGTIKGYDETNDGYLWLQTKPTFEVFRFPAIKNDIVPPLRDLSWTFDLMPVFDESGNPKLNYHGKQIFKKQFKVTVKNRDQYETLFPEKYQIEDLMVKFLELLDKGKSPDVFYSEFMLVASNPKGKFFNKDRIQGMKSMNHPKFYNVQTFCDFIYKYNIPVYLWIDPGGEKSHGICMAVVVKYQGCYYVLDVVVVRAGLPEAAKVLARLLEKWRVKIWGVEGNFSQHETYGNTLKRELKRRLTQENKMHLYKPPVIRPNTENKIQRIREGFSSMIGLEGMDYTFFINEDAQSIDRFNKEVKEFGGDVKAGQRHEYDVLDCIVSAEIHLTGRGTEPIVASHH